MDGYYETAISRHIFPGSCTYKLPEIVMMCTRPEQVEARQNHSTELGNCHKVPPLAE